MAGRALLAGYHRQVVLPLGMRHDPWLAGVIAYEIGWHKYRLGDTYRSNAFVVSCYTSWAHVTGRNFHRFITGRATDGLAVV